MLSASQRICKSQLSMSRSLKYSGAYREALAACESEWLGIMLAVHINLRRILEHLIPPRARPFSKLPWWLISTMDKRIKDSLLPRNVQWSKQIVQRNETVTKKQPGFLEIVFQLITGLKSAMGYVSAPRPESVLKKHNLQKWVVTDWRNHIHMTSNHNNASHQNYSFIKIKADFLN